MALDGLRQRLLTQLAQRQARHGRRPGDQAVIGQSRDRVDFQDPRPALQVYPHIDPDNSTCRNCLTGPKSNLQHRFPHRLLEDLGKRDDRAFVEIFRIEIENGSF